MVPDCFETVSWLGRETRLSTKCNCINKEFHNRETERTLKEENTA